MSAVYERLPTRKNSALAVGSKPKCDFSMSRALAWVFFYQQKSQASEAFLVDFLLRSSRHPSFFHCRSEDGILAAMAQTHKEQYARWNFPCQPPATPDLEMPTGGLIQYNPQRQHTFFLKKIIFP